MGALKLPAVKSRIEYTQDGLVPILLYPSPQKYLCCRMKTQERMMGYRLNESLSRIRRSLAMLQNKQIVLNTFSGYLNYCNKAQPELSLEAAYQIAALLTQAEFSLQAAEAARRP